jgi:hypothetical protein
MPVLSKMVSEDLKRNVAGSVPVLKDMFLQDLVQRFARLRMPP